MFPEADRIELGQRDRAVVFRVKVVPGATRTRVAGEWNGALRVTVAAAPQAGKANEALLDLLGRVLGVRRADVSIVDGHARPLKRVAVRGTTVEAVRARLRDHSGS